MSKRTAPRKRISQVEELENRRVLAQVLPDLFAWEGNTNQYLHDYRIEGDLLRFSTALGNQGAGHLEIRGGAALPNGNQEVFQRIYHDDGSHEDVLAGEFTYHPGHGHIHFDGYAIYNLRERLPDDSVGDVISSGGKVSFCLIDIRILQSGSGMPSNYGGCGATVQGISAGWSDVYSSGLSDQWINISTVADGDYYLEVVVDPDDQLVESDEFNNVTTVPVTIDRGGTSSGDIYEQNNTFAAAADLGVVAYLDQPGLSIHDATDVDYFRFEAVDSGNFDASIIFTNALGNLDLSIYDASQQFIGSSNTSNDLESVSWPVTAGEVFYAKIESVGNATNGYDLELDGPGTIVTETVASDDSSLPIPIPDDGGGSISSTLPGPDIGLSDVNLVLNDLDHTYVGDLRIQVTSPAGTTATVLRSANETPAGFMGGGNDFTDTVIDDQSPNFLGNASAPFTGIFNVNHSSVDNNPLAVFNGQNASGQWTLTVTDLWSNDTGTLRDWSLQFTGVPAPDGDRFETNNDFPHATDLGTLGSAHEDTLSIHNAADVDYFRFTAQGAGLAQVDALFQHADGDLELVLYDNTLTEIGRSSSSTDNENLSVPVASGELIYIQVLGVAGATNADYTLNVSVGSLAGDFTGDGIVDADDVQDFCQALSGGSTDPVYDLNDDELVNALDGEELVFNIMGFLPGDADFDGGVDVSDFNLWNQHKFQVGCYTDGDFNFDGFVDVTDFGIWNNHKFTGIGALATPGEEMEQGVVQDAALRLFQDPPEVQEADLLAAFVPEVLGRASHLRALRSVVDAVFTDGDSEDDQPIRDLVSNGGGGW